MIDDELRKVDRVLLRAEREVLEELLGEQRWGYRAKYWREELARIKETLGSLCGPEGPHPDPPRQRGG